MTDTITRTQKQRLEAAFAALREQGITPTLLMDDTSIVRSDAVDAYRLASEHAGTTLWAGTGVEHGTWVDGRLHVRAVGGDWTVPVTKLYFDFPHEPVEVARRVATAVVMAFAFAGLDSFWSGDVSKCVAVRLTD